MIRFKCRVWIVVLLSASFISNSYAQIALRPVSVLSADSSGLKALSDMVASAKNKVEVLPADKAKAGEALYHTQVTTRSLMGAIVYYTGGIMVDNGWLRLLGSGSIRFPRSLPDWNKGKTFENFGQQPGYILIADDVIGGYFAVNGGALGTDAGMVYYLAPNTMQWESLNRGYTDFVDFCFNGDLEKFYSGHRWTGWRTNVAKLNGNQAFSFYPYLWSEEGQDINKVVRSIVPAEELYNLTITMQQTLSKNKRD